MRISGFSSLFSANAVFLYPPTNVLKVLRPLGKSRKRQKSSQLSKEKVNKEMKETDLFWGGGGECNCMDQQFYGHPGVPE